MSGQNWKVYGCMLHLEECSLLTCSWSLPCRNVVPIIPDLHFQSWKPESLCEILATNLINRPPHTHTAHTQNSFGICWKLDIGWIYYVFLWLNCSLSSLAAAWDTTENIELLLFHDKVLYIYWDIISIAPCLLSHIQPTSQLPCFTRGDVPWIMGLNTTL